MIVFEKGVQRNYVYGGSGIVSSVVSKIPHILKEIPGKIIQLVTSDTGK